MFGCLAHEVLLTLGEPPVLWPPAREKPRVPSRRLAFPDFLAAMAHVWALGSSSLLYLGGTSTWEQNETIAPGQHMLASVASLSGPVVTRYLGPSVLAFNLVTHISQHFCEPMSI